MIKKLIALLAIAVVVCVSATNVAQGQTSDAPPVYKDASRPVAERVKDLLGRMTLDEKIGQITLVEKGSMNIADVGPLGIGGVLSGGGGFPKGDNTPQGWAAMVDGFQKEALQTRLGIPIIYGVDAVHGHNNLFGAVIYPHPVGLGAANDADLVQRIGRATAEEMIATGIYWDYAPMVAVAQDIRWGRAYESYSENTALVSKLSSALIQGLQGAKLNDPGSVLATAKHFIGDGGTKWGTSTTTNGSAHYMIDQGVTDIDEATLRAIHLPPYIASIKAGAQSVMVSYSSFGGMKMSAQKHLITDVLKGELGFTGFVVSDWQAIDAISGDYDNAVAVSMNAGMDMVMVPYDYHKFITALQKAVASGAVSQSRIDDAVSRILKVKFELGLFERPLSDPAKLSAVGAQAHRDLAREAVSKSLVLLQNTNSTLPIAKDVTSIYVAGQGADDIGMQTGGWTIEWQGKTGNITPGTTILQGIKATVSSKTTVTYDATGQFDGKAPIGIAVVGERPYAEGIGDSNNLSQSQADVNVIANVRSHSDKTIVILLSGRPMIIGPQLLQSDAFVAAWLPGTEGQGVSDVLFGDKPFTGKLAFTWPRSMDQLPFNFKTLPTTGCDAPLFPFGYGLDAKTKSSAPVRDVCLKATSTPTIAPPTDTPMPQADLIAPPEIQGKAVYIPFPVTITLDGKLDDWKGVPVTTVKRGPSPSSDPAENGSFTFAVAADATTLYVQMQMPDKTIITGKHGTNFWNEDSMEFYVNQSGDLAASAYADTIFQVNINPGDIGKTDVNALTITGINGDKSKVKGIVFKTANGWGFEAAVPLLKKPEHGAVIGFQAQINGAAELDRNVKLIWSLADTGDLSYQNPSLFGQGIFFQVGSKDVPTPKP